VQAQAAALAGHPLLFINLHPADLLDHELVDWGGGLRQIASRVVLEISEHADLACIPNAALRVGSLRKMGFRVALDDIGAANAGILPFSRLDPDFLKLDVSLVRGVEDDDAKRRVVSAVTGFARDLRMHVVAEGVETIAESRTLADLGCDLLQGYLFARPGPAFPEVNWPHSSDEPRTTRKVSGEFSRVR
jgi:EAL domain-containing protein (putative c-di-GMP-specific phosphodiesterase class I)